MKFINFDIKKLLCVATLAFGIQTAQANPITDLRDLFNQIISIVTKNDNIPAHEFVDRIEDEGLKASCIKFINDVRSIPCPQKRMDSVLPKAVTYFSEHAKSCGQSIQVLIIQLFLPHRSKIEANKERLNTWFENFDSAL